MPFGRFALHLHSIFPDYHHFPHALDHPRPLFGTHQAASPAASRPPIRRRRRRPCTRDDDDLVALVHGTMARAEPSLFVPLSDDDDDDLVEFVSTRPSRPSAASSAAVHPPTPLALPRPSQPPTTTTAAASTRRRHAEPYPPPPPQVSRQDDAFIDLTEEPDSPAQVRPPQTSNGSAAGQPPTSAVRLPPMRLHRHPRRTNSQRLTPPRLSRSESIILASEPSFIDLTGDDDYTNTNNNNSTSNSTSNAGTNEPPRRSHRNQQPPIIFAPDGSAGPTSNNNTNNNNNNNNSNNNNNDRLVNIELLSRQRTFSYSIAATFARGFGRTFADIFTSDMLNGTSASNLSSNGFTWGPPQQPNPPRAKQPVPPAKPGFTRETVAAVEDGGNRSPGAAADGHVFVCPSCDEELAYDPTDGVVQTATGAKKRKRAPGDHHFWAVKTCGHVYCSDCFENRRPTKATVHHGVGFRDASGKLSRNVPATELRCAVEGCGSKVANKTEWVGIFL